MALNVTPFVGTDNFNMETFNNMISQINSGVNSEILDVLAQLGTKAKIQTGSYIGTGTYGSNNPNTLTFDFEPKLLIVAGTVNGHSTNQVYGVTVIYIEGQNEYGFLVQTNAGYVNGNVYRDGNTISWYNTDSSSQYSPGLQFNISGETYSYIAFGYRRVI